MTSELVKVEFTLGDDPSTESFDVGLDKLSAIIVRLQDYGDRIDDFDWNDVVDALSDASTDIDTAAREIKERVGYAISSAYHSGWCGAEHQIEQNGLEYL